jgi:hypothetical protein
VELGTFGDDELGKELDSLVGNTLTIGLILGEGVGVVLGKTLGVP